MEEIVSKFQIYFTFCCYQWEGKSENPSRTAYGNLKFSQKRKGCLSWQTQPINHQLLTSRHNKGNTRIFLFYFSLLYLRYLLYFISLFPALFKFTQNFTMARTTQNHRRPGSSKPPATIPALSPAPNSKLPAQLRFPLLVFSSLTLSASLYFLISPFTSGDLATVSRSRDNWLEGY